MVSPGTLLQELPPFRGSGLRIVNRQSTKSIIKQILKAHTLCAADYDTIAYYFYSTDPDELSESLFRFCKKYIPYSVEDEDLQTTRSPAGILAMSDYYGADCKHYASFIGGVIDAVNKNCGLDYQWFYRFANYGAGLGHVFVVLYDEAGNEIWIDPVLTYLNQRFPFPFSTKDKSAPMLKHMSGISSVPGTDPIPSQDVVSVDTSGTVNAKTQTTGQAKIETAASALEIIGTGLDTTGVGAVAGVGLNAVGAVPALAGKLFGFDLSG